MRVIAILLACLLLSPAAGAQTPPAARSHAFAVLGKPDLPADFPYFPYVNPAAPKGGELALSAIGTFDSFNPFIVRGVAASGVGRVYDTLLKNSADEAGVGYGHLAQSIEVALDKSWVAFELRPEARFHDGRPVTAADVAWTFTQMREKGRPFYRQYYADVAEAVVEGPRRIVFRFSSTENRELPLILGEMPVLPKHWWQGRDFSRPLTDPPLGSGPYRVERFEFGRSITYARVPDWWAHDLPTGKGLYNFDAIRTEYFRDATVAFEAFKAGQVDFRQENIAKQWATAYDFSAVQRGQVVKEEIRHRLPTGMQGFAMNTRRPLFKDVRVRQALAWAFDYEWMNRNMFYGAYTRTKSYFSNSDLASSNLPSEAELALLEPYRSQLPPQLFSEPYKLPVTDGSGNNREELRRALALFKEAGWEVKERKLVDRAGNGFSFEILLPDASYERATQPYVQTLSRLGIEARVRTVDPAQYQRRMDDFDYDMTMTTFGESEYPGNEQYGYWSCESAKHEGSNNIMGVCDPVIDALVAKVVAAPDRPQLIAATRALDRVLLWNWYLVPNWHLQTIRAAWWNKFARPEKPIRVGLDLDTWWIDRAKEKSAEDAKKEAGGTPR